MLSGTYSTELNPDRRLRKLVIGAGAAVSALGVVAIWTLPWPLPFRLLAVSAWTAAAAADLVRTLSGFGRCNGIRIEAGGEVALLAPDGRWTVARLQPGSIVLGSLAWLRLESADGIRFGELLRGDARETEEWRRFQVIWKHLGPAR